jgi:polyisoprenoid-binding protein YceI
MPFFRKTAVALSLAAGIVATGQALAADYTLDTAGMHAAVNFRANHLGYSFVTGRFNTFSGSFSFDNTKPAESTVSIEIDTTSVNSNHEKRDEHLRSADFFDVENHPKASFVSTSVTPTGDKTADVKGDLTIRGVSKEVTLKVTYIGEGNDPWGGYRAGFSASTEITPADFGMPHGVAKAPVQILIEAEGTRN